MVVLRTLFEANLQAARHGVPGREPRQHLIFAAPTTATDVLQFVVRLIVCFLCDQQEGTSAGGIVGLKLTECVDVIPRRGVAADAVALLC
jgi:hypothetical protein